MDPDIEHMKAVILRHKREMATKQEKRGDGAYVVLFIFIFVVMFGGYASCITALLSGR